MFFVGFLPADGWRKAGGRQAAAHPRKKAKSQTVCKPGSVRTKVRDGHSSGTPVAGRLARPTRTACRKRAITVPIGSCSRWGLPCRRRRRRRGALLPHPFTLARRAIRRCRAVCFLWHFPWGRPRRALPGTVVPRSPDFPRPACAGRGRPTLWPGRYRTKRPAFVA